MERLVTGGVGLGAREVREWTPTRRVSAEQAAIPVVADPLPGESTDWAFFGLLAFTALLFFRPQDQLRFLAPLHLAEVSAIVALVAMAGKRLVRRLPVSRFTPELGGLVAFGAVLVATTPFSYWPGGSIEVITGLYLKVLLIVVLMVNSLTTPRRLQRFTSLVVVASAYLAARAVFDYVRGINLVEHGRIAGAVGGIFGNPNDLALNMVAFLPFAALFALRTRPRSGSRSAARRPRAPGGLPRLVAAGACGLMFLATIFTKSRGGALGLGVMFLVLLWYTRRLHRGLGAAGLVLLLITLPLLPASFWGRMVSIVDAKEDATGSREARRQVMTEAAQVFLERPLTGIGAGQFKNYNPPGRVERWREAHDVWLQVASETGIGGLVVFLYLVVAAVHGATWSRKRLWPLVKPARRPVPRPHSGPPSPALAPPATDDLIALHLHGAALVASLAGWIVCATFASVAYNWTFYYLLGLCITTRLLTAEYAPRAAQAGAARHVVVRSLRYAR